MTGPEVPSLLKQLAADTYTIVQSLESDPLPTSVEDLTAEVAQLVEPIQALLAIRAAAYQRQTLCFRALRDLEPPLTYQKIGEAAGISEEAVIRRIREPGNGKAKKAPAKKRAAKKAAAKKR